MVLPDRRTASVLLTILLFAIVVAVVYVARTVIAIFAFSILFAYLINPIVRFLQRHRANIEHAAATIEESAPAALAGFVVIPILAIFFLSDGENLANQVIHLVSAKENHAALRSLADELHVMLQHYIRAKVILGGLSLTYCSVAMLVFGFPNAIVLGVLAGILEFIPVAGWMTAAVIIVTAGALSHSPWIWMLALLVVWRILMDYGIAPRVMGHELEIHPLLAIFTLMVGGAVGGIVGIYLSVPLVAALRFVYQRFAWPQTDTTLPGRLVDTPEPRGETSVMA